MELDRIVKEEVKFLIKDKLIKNSLDYRMIKTD